MARQTQREFMRELGGDRAVVVQSYASAERDGIVDRKRNANRQTPEQYAEALFADGIAKGWLGSVDLMSDTHAVARSLTAVDFTPAQADVLTEGSHGAACALDAGGVSERPRRRTDARYGRPTRSWFAARLRHAAVSS